MRRESFPSEQPNDVVTECDCSHISRSYKMTRAQRFFTATAVVGTLWLLLLLDVLPLPIVGGVAKKEILVALPWWVLVSTGSYLLFEIGWGLWTFNDVPKAYDDLMIDIKEAKDFLGSKGVHLD